MFVRHTGCDAGVFKLYLLIISWSAASRMPITKAKCIRYPKIPTVIVYMASDALR